MPRTVGVALPFVRNTHSPVEHLVGIEARGAKCQSHRFHQILGRDPNQVKVFRVGNARNQHINLAERKYALQTSQDNMLD